MAGSLRRIGLSSAIFVFCLACYLANGRTYSYNQEFDQIGTRTLPFSILRYGKIALEPFREDFFHERRYKGITDERRGKLISGYPIGGAFVALPIYAPYYAALAIENQTSHSELFAKTRPAEKAAASLIAALSVVTLFFIAAPRLGDVRAAAVALVFGIGTPIWAVASQQLWQHGPGVLCVLLGIWAICRERQSWKARAFAGFWLGMAFAVRPQNLAFLAAGAAAEFLIAGGRFSARFKALVNFALGAVIPVGSIVVYNIYYFGHPMGSYSTVIPWFRPSLLAQGVPGLLLSPNRGLLVFAPVVLVGFIGIAIALRHPRSYPIEAAFTVAAIAFFLLHACFLTWAGGWTFGPRYLIETLPVLALTSTLAIRRIRWTDAARTATLAAIGWSALIECNGAFCYPASNWNARMSDHIEEHAWDFRHLGLWEDSRIWKAGRSQNRWRPLEPVQARARQETAITTRTPTEIPGAKLSLTPAVSGRAVVGAVFDLTFESDHPGIFIGKLRINGVEQPDTAVFRAALGHSRATISQDWMAAVQEGKAVDLTLTGQLGSDGGSYLVSPIRTTLTTLLLPR